MSPTLPFRPEAPPDAPRSCDGGHSICDHEWRSQSLHQGRHRARVGRRRAGGLSFQVWWAAFQQSVSISAHTPTARRSRKSSGWNDYVRLDIRRNNRAFIDHTMARSRLRLFTDDSPPMMDRLLYDWIDCYTIGPTVVRLVADCFTIVPSHVQSFRIVPSFAFTGPRRTVT